MIDKIKTKKARTKKAVLGKIAAKAGLNAHIKPGELTTAVAVFTSGRSGTSLISSLLDGHPYVAATPDQIMIGFYLFWEEFGDLESGALAEAFIDQFETLFNGAAHCKNLKSSSCGGEEDGFTTMGENRDQTLSADVDVFRASMKAMLPPGQTVTRRLFTQAMHLAYSDAIGHRLEAGAIIMLGLHTVSHPVVIALSEDFENPRPLHMVREPIQTLGSHFRHKQGAGDLKPRTSSMIVRNRYTSGKPALENLKFQSRALRLEDLHIAPKRTMMAVCGWLNIPWDETLLQSTFNGLKFWNDSSSAHQVSGFNKDIIAQKHEGLISRFDRLRYTVMFARRFQAFGYLMPNTVLCRRAVFLLLLPLFALPFRVERLSWQAAGSAKNIVEFIKYYIKLRLLIVARTLNPADTVPLLTPNTLGGGD